MENHPFTKGDYKATEEEPDEVAQNGIKEVVEMIIDECANRAKVMFESDNPQHGGVIVDRDSILSLKKELNYSLPEDF